MGKIYFYFSYIYIHTITCYLAFLSERIHEYLKNGPLETADLVSHAQSTAKAVSCFSPEPKEEKDQTTKILSRGMRFPTI